MACARNSVRIEKWSSSRNYIRFNWRAGHPWPACALYVLIHLPSSEFSPLDGLLLGHALVVANFC